jgi:alpha-L-fucosidase
MLKSIYTKKIYNGRKHFRLKIISLAILFNFLFLVVTFGQKIYLPTEESLKERTTPEWFGNAKLGIFIHWGLYSVPGWAKPDFSVEQVSDWKLFYRNNPYAEWYLNSLRIPGSPTVEYHKNKYGADFSYYNFRDTLALKSKNWNAEQWAKLFSDMGAKYVVITSKHSDGFVMYPSKVINPFFEKDEITSRRDFVGELEKASRKHGLKFGVYYSGGLDWTFNQSPVTNLWPDLFLSMPTSVAYTSYADSHMHEIIHRYRPDMLWNDVNYPDDGDFLGIFSELFNLNPNALINDRWRKHEALFDYTTPEYQVLDSIVEKKWETCRGLGYSFGFNRLEDDNQVISSKDLVRLLVDIVSKNGNLLLNVGPKDDGTIPKIQLDRLTDLGAWLKINGEGIFDSKPWKRFAFKNSNGLDLRFTRKGNTLYAFIFNLPKNRIVYIPDLLTGKNSEAIAFGETSQKVKIVKSNTGLEIRLPENLSPLFCLMLKITNITE